MRGVLLDPTTGRPKTAEREQVARCNVCGLKFFEGELGAWERHVGKCAREHLPEIEAARRRDIFTTEHPDPELRDHMLGIGRRMIRENRWEIKPNEAVRDG